MPQALTITWVGQRKCLSSSRPPQWPTAGAMQPSFGTPSPIPQLYQSIFLPLRYWKRMTIGCLIQPHCRIITAPICHLSQAVNSHFGSGRPSPSSTTRTLSTRQKVIAYLPSYNLCLLFHCIIARTVCCGVSSRASQTLSLSQIRI